MATVFATPYTCVRCRQPKSYEQMRRVHGIKRGNICKACHAASQHKHDSQQAPAAKGAAETTVELCRAKDCNEPVIGHWQCRRPGCRSRGHLMGRGTNDPTLCGWCDKGWT